LKSQQVNNTCELAIEQTSRQSAFKKKKIAPNMIGLGGDAKRILACTAREANRFRDYWIDTEHLVLGILREGDNAGAAKLRAIGLDLEDSRRRVIESKNSRPTKPNPVLWWVQRRPLGMALAVVFFLGVLVALILLGFGGAR
jgi:ATP-dependent Clp protease ATP-binding subunit ClpA